MKFHAICLSLFLLAGIAPAQTLTDSSLTVTQIVTGLNVPIGIAFLNTNDILVLEKNTGIVRRVIDSVLQTNPVLDVAVDNTDERGLLSIALHPGFATNNLVYLCYTESATPGVDTTFQDPLCICLYRYEWDGNVLTNGTQIFSFPVEPGIDYHNGGFILFGPDNKLYAVTGDHERFGALQNQQFGDAPDDTSVIVRLNDDGTAPSDNPFFSQLGMTNVFAYGVRNSFGFTFDPLTGNLWDTENGENDYDEINLVMPGFNSGWREIMGPASRSDGSISNLVSFAGSQYSDPEFSWSNTVAPTGITFLNSGALGEQYRNDLFVGDYNNGLLYHFDLNAQRNALVLSGGLSDKVADTAGERDLAVIGTGFGVFSAEFGEFAGISAVKVGPDGRLYVVSIGTGTIYAIFAKPVAQDHNLALVSVQPPKKITLSGTVASVTKPVKVQIQNLGDHTESIDATAFENLVTVNIESLGDQHCSPPTMNLLAPKKGFPITLAPKKKLTLVYNVTFDCANDPAATTKDAFHSDFRYTVTVDHSVLGTGADTEPGNDSCPRPASGSDKGCGGKDPVTKQIGADILTDVVMK